MKYSQDAVDLIREWEGFEPKPYICGAGQKTVGYGHAILGGAAFEETLTETQALRLLQRDLNIVCVYQSKRQSDIKTVSI